MHKNYSILGDRTDVPKALLRAAPGNGLNSAFNRVMKTFLVLVLSVIALFVWQRQNQGTATPGQPSVGETTSAIAAPRPVSEHNWARHSLDRAHEVVNEVQQSREQNEER